MRARVPPRVSLARVARAHPCRASPRATAQSNPAVVGLRRMHLAAGGLSFSRCASGAALSAQAERGLPVVGRASRLEGPARPRAPRTTHWGGAGREVCAACHICPARRTRRSSLLARPTTEGPRARARVGAPAGAPAPHAVCAQNAARRWATSGGLGSHRLRALGGSIRDRKPARAPRGGTA